MATIESDAPTVALATLLFICIWLFLKLGGNNVGFQLPPGPRPWPVLGSLHLLGNLPHVSLSWLSKKYGPLMFLRLGSVPTIVVSSPSMAREILQTHDLVFANRPNCATGKYICYDHKDVGFAHYGEYWRQMKKLCTVELLTAKRVESFASVREEEISAMIRSVWEESGRGIGSVNVTKMVELCTRNIVCKMFASRTYSDHELGAGHGFAQMIDEIFSVAGAFCVGDFIPFLHWLDLQGIHGRMKKVHQVYDRFAEKVIDEHIKRRASNHEQQQGRVKDMVDVLLDMAEGNNHTDSTLMMKITRVNIKAIILDVLNAGIETSSTTTVWALSELLRNPRVLAKAQAEIESVAGRHRSIRESDLRRCEYLRCVIKETFRFHPPLPFLLPHESREACSVGSYFIPAKTRVLVNVWAMGRDENVWEDPMEFKPERFIGKDMDVRGQDFELIPFGTGRRGCPGTTMGLAAVELELGQLLHCFDWAVEGDMNMEEKFGLTVPRKYPLMARPSWRLTDGFTSS